MLGNEIETLISEYRLSGIHSVQFIADTELPSGIYFYRINTENFSDTKKFIYQK